MTLEVRSGQVWRQAVADRTVWLAVLLESFPRTGGTSWSAYAMVTPHPGRAMYMPYFVDEDILMQLSWHHGVTWELISGSTSSSDGLGEAE